MQDFGKLLLRVTIGGLLLFHGVNKIQHGISGIETMVKSKDLPSFLAWGVYVGEVLAPALLIFGFMTRLAGFAVAVNIGMAVWLVHMGSLTQINQVGGYELELQALYALGAVAILFLGPGRFAVSQRG